MTEYPEIENFPAIMKYWEGHGYISRKSNLEVFKENPDLLKKICDTMVMYAIPAMEEAKQYNTQYKQARKDNPEKREKEYFPPVTAEPFKKLSVIFEKEGNLVQAIYYCKQAIKLGLIDDGTKAGMKGRLEKLLKRYNEQCPDKKNRP